MVVTQLQELGKACILRLFLLLCQSLFSGATLLSLFFCALFSSSKFALQDLNLVCILMRHLMCELSGYC